MTTEAAARLYEAQHLMEWGDKGYALHNPNDRPVVELPVIYGFNNGGSPGWYSGCLIAEDSTGLGGHLCSSEGYMPHDLGIVAGARQDRHETFRKHYPDGYRMEFVSYRDIDATPGLLAAFEKNKEQAASADTHPQDGDSTEIEAPLVSGAVPHEDAADAQPTESSGS